ncbi:MAG: type III secretion system chaperone [Opitutaceae bacterium]|nr:type III secretion system chaperone [Opitutaceae bacterium]
MSTLATELTSSLLKSWVSEVNRDLGWEGSVDDEGFCVFGGKDGHALVVQADDRVGVIRFSSEVGGPVAEDDGRTLASLLTANFRGLALGLATFSLHPESRKVHFELVWSDPDRGGIDRFATLAERFSQLAARARQLLSDGTLAELWRQTPVSESGASDSFIRA